jgi:hypothetical protein
MKAPKEKARAKVLSEKLERFRKEFQEDHDDAEKQIVPDLLQFLVSLATEGERSAVVLGAERINVALEALLKRFLIPPTNKNDGLFSSEGALATFSRKTEMAHRLGLIDSRFKRALGLVRRLRNDFAHAIKVEKLDSEPHASRLAELSTLVGEGNQHHFTTFLPFFEVAQTHGEHGRKYLSCVMILLLKLELVRHHLKPPEILLPAKLDYQEEESE